jgi:hypothetical protein
VRDANFAGVFLDSRQIANALIERLEAAIHSSGRITAHTEVIQNGCNVRLGDHPGPTPFPDPVAFLRVRSSLALEGSAWHWP